MKRNLFQNVLVVPYKSGDAIDREGYLSAVVGAVVAPGAEVKVTVEHSDDGETFVPVTDERVFPEKQTEGGVLTFTAPTVAAAATEIGRETEGSAAAGISVNIDVDLVGLKNLVKFTVTGTDSLAVAVGDHRTQPV